MRRVASLQTNKPSCFKSLLFDGEEILIISLSRVSCCTDFCLKIPLFFCWCLPPFSFCLNLIFFTCNGISTLLHQGLPDEILVCHFLGAFFLCSILSRFSFEVIVIEEGRFVVLSSSTRKRDSYARGVSSSQLVSPGFPNNTLTQVG